MLRVIVTVDNIVDVVQEEATEDIQKLAAMEAFDLPYLRHELCRHAQEACWLVSHTHTAPYTSGTDSMLTAGSRCQPATCLLKCQDSVYNL
jgi:Mg/Co/Ni transporter MgtE